MRSRVLVLALVLIMAPLGARAADLVVWWEEGYYDQENEAVGEIIAAFEHKTGKQVELALLDEEETPGRDRGGARRGPAARLRLRHAHGLLHLGVGIR
jgi:ABC-type glycerol-3-phosphate transport system substrate-binding protein